MEYVSVVTIEDCSLVIWYEIVHTDGTIHLIILLLLRLTVYPGVDILEGVSSKPLYGTDTGFFIVDPVSLFEIVDKHLQTT